MSPKHPSMFSLGAPVPVESVLLSSTQTKNLRILELACVTAFLNKCCLHLQVNRSEATIKNVERTLKEAQEQVK